MIRSFLDTVPGSIVGYGADSGALIVNACDAAMTFGFRSVSDGLIDTHTIGTARP
jgi:hypothetical protein